jgi:hypothetical protein
MTAPNPPLNTEPIRGCPDPECHDPGGAPSIAEPEQDGEHHFWICTNCGYSFGYHRPPQHLLAVSSDGACAVGIPEALRRAAQPAAAPLLQIGRRHDGTTA